MELLIGFPIILGYLFLTVYFMVHAYHSLAQQKFGMVGKVVGVLSTLFLAFSVPFGDHIIGHVYFSHLCKKEAGTKIYRTVAKVDGLWWWPISSGQMALENGYAFVEGGVDPKKVRRYVITDGVVVEEKNVQMISTYVVRSGEPKEIGWGIIRGKDIIVEDLRSNETLAETTSFQYRGGWLVRALLTGYGGSAAKCHAGLDREKFITTVLQPVNRGK